MNIVERFVPVINSRAQSRFSLDTGSTGQSPRALENASDHDVVVLTSGSHVLGNDVVVNRTWTGYDVGGVPANNAVTIATYHMTIRATNLATQYDQAMVKRLQRLDAEAPAKTFKTAASFSKWLDDLDR